ncbi:beta-taxilin isoform X3 [Amia ocellicauda]|uniref:beta-taxilin isoform X3 n=1 Tax=Amia ocellicauda TaxID=2972642 RepID=UPI003464288A
MMENNNQTSELTTNNQQSNTGSEATVPEFNGTDRQDLEKEPTPEPKLQTVVCDISEELGRQLEDIINTYGSASSLVEEQSICKESEDVDKGDSLSQWESEESNGDQSVPGEGMSSKEASATKEQKLEKKIIKGLGKEATLLMQSLNKLNTPEEKLEALFKKYAELEETFQRCREDEEKRKEITTHFQSTLNDIQVQIEQHSDRNNKLCLENTELAEKLKGIIDQYEQREEHLDKIFKHRDLQQKLADAKLEQAEMKIREAEAKHAREKEYLLNQAAEWKLQANHLKEQETVMKAQLSLYSEKFEEFQGSLAKSNDVFTSFKQEMDKMTKKMKKLEKESTVWRTRFESCNKALVDMIEEKALREKEFGCFSLKIQRLENLCRALQDERTILYKKISEVRNINESPKEKEEMIEEEAPQELPWPKELVALKAEEDRLKDLAASFMVSHNSEERPESPDSVGASPEAIEAERLVDFQEELEEITHPNSVPIVSSDNPAQPDSKNPCTTQENMDKNMEVVE